MAEIPSFGCFRLSAEIADFEAPLSVSAETLSVDHYSKFLFDTPKWLCLIKRIWSKYGNLNQDDQIKF